MPRESRRERSLGPWMLCCIGTCMGVTIVLIGAVITGAVSDLPSDPSAQPRLPGGNGLPPPSSMVRGPISKVSANKPLEGRQNPAGNAVEGGDTSRCPAQVSCPDCPLQESPLTQPRERMVCPAVPACQQAAGTDASEESGDEMQTSREHRNGEAHTGSDVSFRRALSAYARIHNRIVSSKATGPSHILNCKPSAQMGNRIRFVASCLLFAMVSDRALLVAFKDGYYASLDDLFVSPGFEWERGAAQGSIGASSGRSLPPKSFQQMLCGDLGADGLGDAVSIDGNFFFMPYVANNPRYSARVKRWFPDGNIFGAMTRTVFTPNEQVHSMMDSFLLQLGKRHGLPEGQRWSCDVGFQIRNDNDPARHPQISDKEWQLYRKCAEQLLPRSKRESPNVFVATDSEESRAICKREIPYKFDFFGDFKRSNNPDGVRRALVDLLLFSTCDVMLVSPWSSYGRVASVYAGRQAHFVTDWVMPIGEPHRRYLDVLHDEEDPKAGCFRFQNTEPCPWHGPKGVQGFNDVIKTTTCWDASMLSDTC